MEGEIKEIKRKINSLEEKINVAVAERDKHKSHIESNEYKAADKEVDRLRQQLDRTQQELHDTNALLLAQLQQHQAQGLSF